MNPAKKTNRFLRCLKESFEKIHFYDYTDYKGRLHRLNSRLRNLCNLVFNLCKQRSLISFWVVFQRPLKLIYTKLFKIDDTPQRVAIGLGLGVFLGILPGSGPIAALFLSWLLRVNRASALLGSLLTNTWLSIVTFLLSIKIGAAIMGLKWQEVYKDWALFFIDFHWLSLLKLSVLKIVFPVILGYFVIAFISGIFVYLVALIVVINRKKIRRIG